MNSINIIKGVGFSASIINSQYENHSNNSIYTRATINNRTYNYVQELRIIIGDKFHIFDAPSIKNWGGLDLFITWISRNRDEDILELKAKLNWFSNQCNYNVMNLTKLNHLKDSVLFCQYSEEETYSWLRGTFIVEMEESPYIRTEYNAMNVSRLGDFYLDDVGGYYYSNNIENFDLDNGDRISIDTYEDHDYHCCSDCDSVVHCDEGSWNNVTTRAKP